MGTAISHNIAAWRAWRALSLLVPEEIVIPSKFDDASGPPGALALMTRKLTIKIPRRRNRIGPAQSQTTHLAGFFFRCGGLNIFVREEARHHPANILRE